MPQHEAREQIDADLKTVQEALEAGRKWANLFGCTMDAFDARCQVAMGAVGRLAGALHEAWERETRVNTVENAELEAELRKALARLEQIKAMLDNGHTAVYDLVNDIRSVIE